MPGAHIGQYAVAKMLQNPLYDAKDQKKGYDSAYLPLKEPIDLPAEAFILILTNPIEMKQLPRGERCLSRWLQLEQKNVLGVKYETKAMVRNRFKVEVGLGGKGRDAHQGDSGGPAYGILNRVNGGSNV